MSPPPESDWYSPRLPGAGPRLSSSAASGLCTRGAGVLDPNTLATFTFDLSDSLAALGVPLEPGSQFHIVSGRIQVVGVHATNGNEFTFLTQTYPVAFAVGSVSNLGEAYNVLNLAWNTDVADLATAVANGFNQNVGGAGSAGLALITSMAAPATDAVVIVEWEAQVDFFDENWTPAYEMCLSAVAVGEPQ